ncbi:hypothetical protein BS78_01G235200 [Paspalum vaginatum]|nr:hypothetical protein BS78_01G235200 [Paspalum vaginatum]
MSRRGVSSPPVARRMVRAANLARTSHGGPVAVLPKGEEERSENIKGPSLQLARSVPTGMLHVPQWTVRISIHLSPQRRSSRSRPNYYPAPRRPVRCPRIPNTLG